LLEL
jgi:sterol desaturase/sphingolipid hydroxylase (fatty acid hydroxylase superfamily)